MDRYGDAIATTAEADMPYPELEEYVAQYQDPAGKVDLFVCRDGAN